MNRTALLLATTLLTGCLGGGVDPNDETIATECAVEGIHSAISEKPISCRNLSVNIAIARDMMIERKWIADEAEFNKLYAKVQIQIVDRKCIRGPSIFQWIPLKGCLYGLYYTNYENRELLNPRIVTGEPHAIVELNWDAGALAHELMHHYDQTHGRKDVTGEHQDWDTLGYYRFADDYVWSRMALN